MINKLLVFILTLIVSVQANQSCSPWDPRCPKPRIVTNGFYGGVTLGYSNLVGPLNRSLNVNTADRVTSVGENGFAPGVFMGYQNIIDGVIYLAAEGFYNYADVLIEKDENTFPGFVNYFTYIKNAHKGGIVGKVGFVCDNNIFYLKTGLALGRFILGFRDNAGNPPITSSTTRTQKGIILGGGMDYFINKNVAIGLEYEIINYSSMAFKNNAVGSFSFKPTSHTFQVRFKYTL